MEIPDGIKQRTGLVAYYRFRERRNNPQQVHDLACKKHGFLGQTPERDRRDPQWTTEQRTHFARFQREHYVTLPGILENAEAFTAQIVYRLRSTEQGGSRAIFGTDSGNAITQQMTGLTHDTRHWLKFRVATLSGEPITVKKAFADASLGWRCLTARWSNAGTLRLTLNDFEDDHTHNEESGAQLAHSVNVIGAWTKEPLQAGFDGDIAAAVFYGKFLSDPKVKATVGVLRMMLNEIF